MFIKPRLSGSGFHGYTAWSGAEDYGKDVVDFVREMFSFRPSTGTLKLLVLNLNFFIGTTSTTIWNVAARPMSVQSEN